MAIQGINNHQRNLIFLLEPGLEPGTLRKLRWSLVSTPLTQSISINLWPCKIWNQALNTMKYRAQYVKIEQLSIKMLSQGSRYQTPSNDELSNFNLNLVCKAGVMRCGQEGQVSVVCHYLKPTAPLKLSLTNSSCQMMDESIQNAAEHKQQLSWLQPFPYF